MPETDNHHLTCMEVWGGNNPVTSSVQLPGLDAWVYSQPFGQAAGGGDVYYVSSCATGRITRLLVADVSGHGDKVAKLAIELQKMMRRFVNHLDQTRFVQSMNAQFTELSQDGTFATAVVTTFFAPTGSLSLCNAGHPPPLHYRSIEKRWLSLEERPGESRGNNVPLGILNLVDYEQFDAQLESADLVLCYTDSLIEARDASGIMLETSGLLKLIQEIDPTDPVKLVPTLVNRIAARANGKAWDDDVTALLFRPNGGARRVPFFTRAFAPFKVLRRMAFPDFSMANIGGAMFNSLNQRHKRKQ